MRAQGASDDWRSFLLKVGNGEANNEAGEVEVPEENICEGDIIAEVQLYQRKMFKVFGASISVEDTDSLADRAILSPKNSDVNRINDEVMSRLQVARPEDEFVYKSVDTPVSDEETAATYYTVEYLNTLTPTGMPPHELRLKVLPFLTFSFV